jgi:hypothetical protein
MNKPEAPKGYELELSRDYYDYYISQGDHGIIGAFVSEGPRVLFDYFSNGQIIEFAAANLSEALQQVEQYKKTNMTGEF